jgi:TonB-linked outer membrane protein, SusC/RagA family
MKKKIYLFLMLFGSFSTYLIAQTNVSGIVKDAETKETLIGVSVVVKGTTSGTITDMDGKFSLSVAQGKTLVLSFIGYESQEVIVKGGNYTINLKPVAQKLNEVVVIGYGTSKAKDLTAPIAVVKAEDLVKRTTSSPMNALQGSAAGVQVVTVGSPGSSPTVRIRGVGSLNNEGPLYVVDGMFFDNIDFLSSNDIEDMSILKDASAAAIYGVKAANGVVLITTKKGKLNTPTQITYDGYVGVQTPVHMLKMANGSEYAAMEIAKQTSSDLAHVTLSAQKFGGSGTSPTTNTDWYNEILKKSALTHSHNVSIAGGSEKATYNVGMSYLYQDGVMISKNNYKRFNILAQTDFQAYNWLKVGYKVILSNSTLFSPNNAAFANAYYASPLYPVYDPTNTTATPTDYASSTSIGFANGAFSNAVAAANYYYDKTTSWQVMPTVYAEASLIKNKLTFKTQLSEKYASNLELNYTPAYYVDAYQLSPNSLSLLAETKDNWNNYIVDNVLTYKDAFQQHHITAMVGQSIRDERWRQLKGTAPNVPGPQEEYLYLALSQAAATSYTVKDDGSDFHGFSWFGRATYDYASKYLLSATFRADGSSKFQQHWGYFPSVGAGWIISEESFMKQQHLLDYLKARVSWGMLGNDGVPNNVNFATATTNNGVYGSTATADGAYVPGYIIDATFSKYMKWEVVKELDAGIDFSTLGQRLTGTLDYYHRITDNLAFNKQLPMTNKQVYGNWGKVLNQGFEVTLNWADKIGNFGYHIGANLTTVKNSVQDLGGLAYMMTGVAEFPTRMEVGKPINYFYGYQVVGVYQNQSQIDADPIAKANGLTPGDFKYKDQNGDGVLDASDRVSLGNYLPKVTYGANLGCNYKNFELNVMLQGQAGNKILNMNRARRLWYSDMNGDAKLVTNLWSGDGSTNSYPSAYGTTKAWNNAASSFFVENGSYLRIQNIQLAYTFKLSNQQGAPQMRLSLTADRPVIFTKYSGFTPEITGAINDLRNLGYDNQVYPASATYSIGWRLIF